MELKKGFTLLEILLVIALIGILASIVIVAINPSRQLAQARNFQREGHINTINDAVSQYTVKIGGTPEGVAGWYKDICPIGGGIDCVDLSILIPDYLSEIPTEPDGTPYQIALNTTTNKLSLRSGEAELGAEIVTNPLSPVATFAKRVGSTGSDEGRSVDYFDDGSFISTGSFEGIVTFGEGEANETTLTSLGGENMFIAKYAANGNLIWAKSTSGALSFATSVSTYNDGASVVIGEFNSGTITFGQGELNQTSFTQTGGGAWRDIFIAKYNADGSLAWAKSAGGSSGVATTDNAYDVSTLSDGSAIITGDFEGTIIFGQGESNQTTLTSNPVSNGWLYIVKYNANGSLVWAKSAGGDSSVSGYSIATFEDGSSVIGGELYSTAVFGIGEPNQTSIASSSPGWGDTFMAKYNSSGGLVWAKKTGGGPFDDWIEAISADSDGSIIAVGPYENIPTFGQGEVNETTLTSAAGSWGAFMIKVNADGSLAWAKRIVDSDFEWAYHVSVLIDGNIIVGGEFDSIGVFGQGESNEVTLDTAVDGFGYLAKYASDGTLIWVNAGNEFNFGFSDIATHNDGSILTTGSFQSSLIFGERGLNPVPLTSAGSWDKFLVKYNSEGLLE